MKFIGFALIEMNKATGTNDPSTARTYDCVVYDKFGRVHNQNLKLNEIERDWGKMRMTHNTRWMILEGSETRVLTVEEFHHHLTQWNEKAAA